MPKADPLALLRQGMTLAEEGRQREAIDVLDKAIAQDKDLAEAYLFRGNAYDDLGDPERALADLDLALRLNPELVEAYLSRGLVRAELENVEAALQDYAEARRLAPENPYPPLFAAELKSDLGDAAGAMPDYDAAKALAPEDVDVLLGRASALLVLDRMEEALADAEAAIAVAPQSPSALLSAATALHMLEQFDAAIARFDAAIAMDLDATDAAEAHLGRALVHQDAGNLTQAAADYAAAIAQSSAEEDHADLAEALNNLAWLRAAAPDKALRDGNEAVQLAERAVALDRSAIFLETLAAAQARAGRFTEAVRTQQEALENLSEDDADLRAAFTDRLALYKEGKPFAESGD